MLSRSLSLAGVILLASTGFNAASAASPITLRFSSFEPPQAFITSKILAPRAKRVATDSKDTLKIEMYAGGTIGRDPASQTTLVMNGVADIARIVPGYTPGRSDAVTAVELPFILLSAYAGSVANWRMYEDGYWKGGGFDEIKPSCVCSAAPALITTTYSASKLADIKGHKFRAAGPVSLNVIKALGAVPVGGITGPQLAESLARGLVDGTLNEWNALQTFRVLDVAKYHIVLPLGGLSLMVIMNKQKYAGLPPAAKAAIDKNSGEAFAKVFGDAFDQNNADVLAATLKRRDHTVVFVKGDQQRPWRAAVKPDCAQWEKSAPNGAELF